MRHLVILWIIAHNIVITVGKHRRKGTYGKATDRLVGYLGTVLWITVNSSVVVVVIEVVKDDFLLFLYCGNYLVNRVVNTLVYAFVGIETGRCFD